MAVYFIRAGDAGPVKIGVARDPLRRLAELQCGCPDELRLLGVMRGDKALERELQRRFDRHRGEWFKPTADLLALVGSLDPSAIQPRRPKYPRLSAEQASAA